MKRAFTAAEFSARRTGAIRVGLFVGSVLTAYVLTVLPLPEWATPFRPYWVALVMIYWCLTAPGQIGVLAGWVTGLLLDVLTGGLLGLHALGLSIIAYLTLLIYRRARLWPLWQQSLIVTAILLNDRVIALWVRGLVGQEIGTEVREDRHNHGRQDHVLHCIVLATGDRAPTVRKDDSALAGGRVAV